MNGRQAKYLRKKAVKRAKVLMANVIKPKPKYIPKFIWWILLKMTTRIYD